MTGGIYLLLGSNIGDKKKHFDKAIGLLKKYVGPINSASGIYETAAWGKTDQPSFYNQVLKIETELTPSELLTEVNRIEAELGRVREEKWGERVIDIDILYYHSLIIDKKHLKIPHPQLHNRRFTLVPLCEIAGELNHPKLNKTNSELLKNCTDMLEVELAPVDLKN